MGKLYFTTDMTDQMFDKLNEYLGEDCRVHNDWDSGKMTWIDLQITEDYKGLEFSYCEKSYDMRNKIQFVINEMRKYCEDFGLKGIMLAQGEDMMDRYNIIVNNDKVYQISIINIFTK